MGDIMKNLIIALLFIFGFASFSTAGDCGSGTCSAPVRPVRKVVEITRNVIVAPVRVVTGNCCCASTSAVNGSTSKEVCKYQPLRRRLVHRTTNVTTSCCE